MIWRFSKGRTINDPTGDSRRERQGYDAIQNEGFAADVTVYCLPKLEKRAAYRFDLSFRFP